jgi:hypothetical protein
MAYEAAYERINQRFKGEHGGEHRGVPVTERSLQVTFRKGRTFAAYLPSRIEQGRRTRGRWHHRMASSSSITLPQANRWAWRPRRRRRSHLSASTSFSPSSVSCLSQSRATGPLGPHRRTAIREPWSVPMGDRFHRWLPADFAPSCGDEDPSRRDDREGGSDPRR